MQPVPPFAPAAARPFLRTLAGGAFGALLTLAVGSRAAAPGAIDPNGAPRAPALEREGERSLAVDPLGHHPATAPDDGRAWLPLRPVSLFDARALQLHRHRGA